MTKRLFLITLLCCLMFGSAAAAGGLKLPAVMSEAEALRMGERMYRMGVLPSGEPMQAVVMGDIPVDGRMFTCDDCHQRSGLGSEEGTIVTWPTNGRELSRARRKTGAWRKPESETAKQDVRKNLPPYWQQIKDIRPPYTDDSLATLLWTGVDPAGRKLNPVMPVYNLDEADMAILINYLKNLSVNFAPGVDEETIRFATVVSSDVPAESREAMIATLQAHIDVNNAQSRHQKRRATSGPFYKTEMHQAYRSWALDVWELKGAENTWADQLREYYRKQPVFALLGGMTTGSWRPVHEFCEQNKIPEIFPLTDYPVISDSDWYTLYFSKGIYQEGETTARYLKTRDTVKSDARIVIIARDGMKENALIKGFNESWHDLGRPEPVSIQPAPGEKLTERFWHDVMRTQQPDVLILWLDHEDLMETGSLARENKLPGKIILSSEMLDYSFDDVPDDLRDRVFLTYPYSLPDAEGKGVLAVQMWLKARKIPPGDFRMQAKLYFLGWMLAGGIKHMRSEFFREYFLEGFDMMIDQDYAIAVYPRLTFGSGQRYASKGCYMLQLSKGPDPKFVNVSDWVIH